MTATRPLKAWCSSPPPLIASAANTATAPTSKKSFPPPAVNQRKEHPFPQGPFPAVLPARVFPEHSPRGSRVLPCHSASPKTTCKTRPRKMGAEGIGWNAVEQAEYRFYEYPICRGDPRHIGYSHFCPFFCSFGEKSKTCSSFFSKPRSPLATSSK